MHGALAEVRMDILVSVALFVLAGVCEIGGGYLVWHWLLR